MRNAYVVRRPVINRYLVRERDRARLRELVLVLALAIPLGLCVLAYVWLHIESTRSGYRVQALELELDARTRDERRLLFEASRLSNPATVQGRAESELGMAMPSIEQVVFAAEEW